MSEFPRGQAPGNPGGGEEVAGAAGRSAGEPGFENAPGAAALPSMEDTPPGAGGEGRAGDRAAGQAGGGVNSPGLPGSPGGAPGPGAQASAGSGAPTSAGNGAQASAGSGAPTSAGSDGPAGRGPGGGAPGTGQDSGRHSGQYPGSGPLTPGEQVAILDGELERGMGEFDAMILEQQAAQRRAQREQGGNKPVGSAPAGGALGKSGEENGEGGFGRQIGGGSYSVGGGMGGASAGGGRVPPNTAKYPPPADIPSGNDDDVVARQLREAAMREADPAVREKLWAEYRKYKGIKQP